MGLVLWRTGWGNYGLRFLQHWAWRNNLAGAIWKRGQIWGRWIIGGLEELLWPQNQRGFVGSALSNGWVNTTQACNVKIGFP